MLMIPSEMAMPNIRWSSDLAPNGCIRNMSNTADMTVVGLLYLITFFTTEYGISECIRLAWAKSSGELSSARNRWYIVAATLQSLMAFV